MAVAYSVGKVAQLAGVTVRTLHHYGEIGLLEPRERTAAGYRRYSDADLDRLSRILFYRELGFSLDDIGTLLDDPSIDRVEHLRRQHRLLVERLERVQAMVAALEKEMEANMSGVNLTPEEKLEVFGQDYNANYETEAEKRWGGTDEWEQYQERIADHSKADWQRFVAIGQDVHRGLADAFTSGVVPDSTVAMDLAEEHRQWVCMQWDCQRDAHRNLVDMYLADERFMKTYEDMASGLTQWLRDAAYANAERSEVKQ